MENNQKPNAFPKHDGSKELIERYNINDQAYSDSSAKDFVKTVSGFHHADERPTESTEKDNELNRKP